MHWHVIYWFACVLCCCVCVWSNDVRHSWRESIVQPYHAAQHLAMLCHLRIIHCPPSERPSFPLIASFDVNDRTVSFSFLALQRLTYLTTLEMFTFWQAPTLYSIISLANEKYAVSALYRRIESMVESGHNSDEDLNFLVSHVTALRIINNTLHSICDDNFEAPSSNASYLSSYLVMDYISRTQLLERRYSLCRHHMTNTSRRILYDADYDFGPAAPTTSLLYVTERERNPVHLATTSSTFYTREIVGIPRTSNKTVQDIDIGVMAAISIQCDEDAQEKKCRYNYELEEIYNCMMSVLVGMSLSNVNTVDASIEESPHMLAVGLGGGRLHTYAINHHPALHVDTVEISANMLQAAQNYFGFNACDVISAYSADALSDFFQHSFVSAACRSRVILADGSAFLAEAAAQQKLYDFVEIDMFDTRVVEYTGDSGVGDGNIVTPELLRNVARLVHPSRGIALIYLIDDAEYSNHVTAVCHLFKRVIHVAVSGNAHILAASHWEELGVAPDKQYREGEANIDVSYLADRVAQYAIRHNYDSRLMHEYRYAFTELR